MSDDTAPFTEEHNQALFKQVFDLWINPEIERRRTAGTLPDDFILRAAQVIMNVGSPNEIRLNHEVAVVLGIRLDRDVKPGDLAYEEDLDRIEELYLTKERDPNAGHLSLLRVKNRWLLCFDFRYNALRAEELLDAADQFFEAAVGARSRKHSHSFAENLFAATELAAKAELILRPDEQMLKKGTHKLISSRINRERHYGNVDSEFVDVLNKLGQLRGATRYLQASCFLDDEEMSAMEATVAAMLKRTREAVPKRVSSKMSA